ncbi:MAG: hypothetical protein K5675_07700 [Lachnospiraceae bacterium]|nr:hypothetical protein [Lachnospiraceae bacterium]
MKKQSKARNFGQTVGVFGGVLVVCVLLIFGLYMRDYNLKLVNNKLQFVPKISIAVPMNLQLNNTDPGHVIMTTSAVSTAEGVQFRVSGNPFFILAKTYRTITPSHTEANLRSGKTIYVQVRAYKQNEYGRTVYGMWSARKSCIVK